MTQQERRLRIYDAAQIFRRTNIQDAAAGSVQDEADAARAGGGSRCGSS